MLLFWSIVFIVSLAVLVKGADWLLKSAEKIGLAMGLSPFIVGVTIVGVGTSFPELISSIVAVLKGVTEIAPANAIGSNIANILLIVGVSAIVGRRLIVTKSLIDLDLPLLAISTVLLLGIAWDAQITFGESILLIITYGLYLLYAFIHIDEEIEEVKETLPLRPDRRKHLTRPRRKEVKRPKISAKDFLFIISGISRRIHIWEGVMYLAIYIFFIGKLFRLL